MSNRQWDQPGMACMPCRGRGWITQEDATGLPGQDVTCPYCHGEGTSWWVASQREKRLAGFTRRRKIIVALTVALLFSSNLWPSLDSYSTAASYLFVLHLGLFAALLVAWVKSPPRRHIDPDYKPRHAPGFNTDREGKFLAGFAAVVGLRSLFDSSQKRGF